MHEFKLIQDIFPIIETVSRENQLGVVHKVYLQIGALRQVVSEFLRFAFAVVAKDTLAARAELIITLIPVRARCASCKHEFIVTNNTYICPHCGGVKLKILSGKECILASIEGEQQ